MKVIQTKILNMITHVWHHRDTEMPKTIAKTEAEYAPVKIPKSLLDEVDKAVGKFGYRSRAEFVKDAIRSLLREYGMYKSESEEG